MSDSYHKNYRRVSKTMLGHFLTSKDDFNRYYVAQTDEPPAPKRQMVIGSAVHAMALERKVFSDICAIYPESCFKSNGAINPKPAREFERENADKYVLRANDAETVLSTVDAIENHALGQLLATPEAVFEQQYEWTDDKSGLDCRMMVDFSIDMGDHVLAYDLKTTERVYPADIKRTCRQFKYWLQDAHYSSGLETIFGKPVTFVFWFVEVKHPYRIARWQYNQIGRDNANTAYRSAMQDLAKCYASGDFADEWTTETNWLDLNPWEVGADSEGEVAYVDED